MEGWERGRERDLDRHIQECQRPGAGGGGGKVLLSPRHKQTEPLGKRAAFLDTRRQRVNSNKEGEKAKMFLWDTKYFL